MRYSLFEDGHDEEGVSEKMGRPRAAAAGNKSYEDFERRMLQMSIETIIEVKNREQNLKSCSKWIFVLEDIQQKSDCMYCIWGE